MVPPSARLTPGLFTSLCPANQSKQLHQSRAAGITDFISGKLVSTLKFNLELSSLFCGIGITFHIIIIFGTHSKAQSRSFIFLRLPSHSYSACKNCTRIFFLLLHILFVYTPPSWATERHKRQREQHTERFACLTCISWYRYLISSLGLCNSPHNSVFAFISQPTNTIFGAH